MPFIAACLIFSLLPLGLAVLFGLGTAKKPEIHRFLPREKNLGIAIGLVCLAWSAWYVLPLLEGGLARFQPLVKLLVPVVTVLAYFFLNFIFTRALGGIMMLTATYMLHAAFVHHLPLRPVFSILCYLIAVAGMIILALPWRFRDLLQTSSENTGWRKSLTIACGAVGGLLIIFAFL